MDSARRFLLAALLFALGSWACSAGATETAVLSDERDDLLLLYEEKDLVTATKRATPLRMAPAIATIINADEIRGMGARNLLDVLKMVPGMGVSFSEIATNMIEVRGIRTAVNEKILFMVDGHALNRNGFGSALYNFAETMPVENIRQVEVVRGPGSALYGNSAFVATINVITRDADEIDTLELKGLAGSFDTYKGNLVGATTHGERFAALGSFDYYRTNGPRLRVEADALRTTPFSRAPAAPLLDVEQIDAFLKVTYGDLSFRGHYLAKQKGYYVGLGFALVDEAFNDVDYYWGELAYSRNLASELATTVKLYYDHFRQEPVVKIRPNGFGGNFPQGMIGRPLLQNRTFGGEMQLDWNPFAGNHLIAGFAGEEMLQYDVKQLANFNPLTGADIGPLQEVANWNKEASRRIWAFYLQDEWQLLERVNLTAGVRYDHYSDFGGTINPRLGLVWNVLDNADLKFLYGRAFRAPNLVELYTINNPAVIGNPNLSPERIATYEAGLSYHFSRCLATDLTYFYSTIDNLITRNSAVTPVVYTNAGKAKTQGVELGINGRAFESLRWKATYAFQHPRDTLTDQHLPYVPSHRATGSLEYGLTRYLLLHTDLLWTGQRPRSPQETRPKMPSYTTVDLAVTAREFYRGMEVQLAVHNLFDKRFSDPDTSGVANRIPGDLPREGISLLGNMTYRF